MTVVPPARVRRQKKTPIAEQPEAPQQQEQEQAPSEDGATRFVKKLASSLVRQPAFSPFVLPTLAPHVRMYAPAQPSARETPLTPKRRVITSAGCVLGG